MEIKISSKSKKVDFEHRQKTWHGFQSKTSLSKFCVPIDTTEGGSFLIIKIQKHVKPSTDQNTPLRARGTMADIYIYIYMYMALCD